MKINISFMAQGFRHYEQHQTTDALIHDDACVLCLNKNMVSLQQEIIAAFDGSYYERKSLPLDDDWYDTHYHEVVSPFLITFDCCKNLDYVFTSHKEDKCRIFCPRCVARRFKKCNVRVCKKRKYGEYCYHSSWRKRPFRKILYSPLTKEIVRNLLHHERKFVDAFVTSYQNDPEKNALLNEMQARFVRKYGREQVDPSRTVKPLNLLMQFDCDGRLNQNLLIPTMKYINVKEDNIDFTILLRREFTPILFFNIAQKTASVCDMFLFNDCFIGELCMLKAGIEVKLHKNVTYFIQCRVISKLLCD